jgi:predicted PurR-regulated permease PerM
MLATVQNDPADIGTLTIVPPVAVVAHSRLLLGIFLLLLIFAIDFARDFLLPVTMAFFIALTFRPVIRKASRHGIPGWLSATVFMLALVLTVASLIYGLSGPVAKWIADAPELARDFRERLESLRLSLQPIADLTDRLNEAVRPEGGTAVPKVVLSDSSLPEMSILAQGAGYSVQVLAALALTLVTAAFVMASGDLFYEKLIGAFPTLSDKKRALRIVHDVEGEVSSYIFTISAINLGLGISVGVAFWLLGMPGAAMWGVLVFMFNFVPYIGAIFGVSLATFMAVITFDSLGHALLVPFAYLALNGIENQFVTPVLLGRHLQLNAVAILISLTFWTWQWGIAGTMLAVPILMTVKVLASHIDSWKTTGEFLSGRSADSDPVDAPNEARQT